MNSDSLEVPHRGTFLTPTTKGEVTEDGYWFNWPAYKFY